MTTLLTRTLVIGATATALVAVGAGIGAATSTAPIDTNSVRLRVVQSVEPEGFDTGWHTHPGLVVVQVTEGALKIYQGDCQPTVVQKGDTYLEVPLVAARAVGKSEINKWTTTQVIPYGVAPLTPTTSPC